MASRPLHDAFRNVGRNALDLPVAGLSALAVAFAAFVVPAGMLSDAVGASGLPSILPAAEPPLGLTARAGIAVAGALLIFAIVFGLLRLLDRSGVESSRRERADDEAPRTRRRDSHPDAPVRAPISAARDLGEPRRIQSRAAEPTPIWLAEADPGDAVIVDEPVFADPAPEPPMATQPHFEAAPGPESEPAPASPAEPADYFEPVAEEALPQVEVPRPAAELPSSLPELMERLERGLARRQARPASASPAPAQPASAPPQVFPEARDDRLQSAIDSLQRLAARTS